MPHNKETDLPARKAGLRILFWGDVFAAPGREAMRANPSIRKALDVDMVVANGENSAHGFGITEKIAEALFECEIDVITTGNHVWDQQNAESLLQKDERVLRPLNYPSDLPGAGSRDFRLPEGRLVRVINVMGRVFMEPLHDPWHCLQAVLPAAHPRQNNLDAVIVDLHGEATAEKAILAHACDGRVTLIAGTHTHIPTADTRLLPKSTAFQTDIGMCGVYDSIIGVKPDVPLARMQMRKARKRMDPAEGEVMLCGIIVETDLATGLAKYVVPIRVGSGIPEQIPALLKGVEISL